MIKSHLLSILIVIFPLTVRAANTSPIERRSMLARCAAHLVADEVSRAVPWTQVSGILERAIEDLKTDSNDRAHLQHLLKDLRRPNRYSVVEFWRGRREITEFAAGMQTLTETVDDAIRPFVRPPHRKFEEFARGMFLLTSLAGVGYLMGGADAYIFQALGLWIGGTAGYILTDYIMGKLSDRRVAAGWRVSDEGTCEGKRGDFDAKFKGIVDHCAIPNQAESAPIIIRADEFVPAEISRNLRVATTPAALDPAALERLTWTRDRQGRTEGNLEHARHLQLFYVYLPSTPDESVLITIALLKPAKVETEPNDREPPAPRSGRRKFEWRRGRRAVPSAMPAGA